MVGKDYAKKYTPRYTGDGDTLENVVMTILGAVCFMATWYLFGIAILGGF